MKIINIFYAKKVKYTESAGVIHFYQVVDKYDLHARSMIFVPVIRFGELAKIKLEIIDYYVNKFIPTLIMSSVSFNSKMFEPKNTNLKYWDYL